MKSFVREDGRSLRIVPGFCDAARLRRPSVTPKTGWTDPEYLAAAQTKQRRARRLRASFEAHWGSLRSATLLDVGCGDGSNCLCFAGWGLQHVVGIDLDLPLFESGERGDQVRRLAGTLLTHGDAASDAQAKPPAGLDGVLRAMPLEFLRMDAAQLAFEKGSFDVLMSRSAMEHIQPVESALSEMARVVRPGGLIYLGIDPFYWLRGCHKRGLVDIPWAHARLTLAEYRRFVAESEGAEAADKRCRRLETLNRFTVRQWQGLIESMPGEILEWKVRPSPWCEATLAQHPDVLETVLPGLHRDDLVSERIEVWLKRK